MATSEKKTVDGDILVEGLSYELLSVKGREALSTLFRYEAIVEHRLPVPPAEELIGKDASLTLRSAGHARTTVGYVYAVRVLAYDNDKARLAFDLRPRAHAQTLGRDCYAFQDASVVDLIQDRVADVGMPVRYALGRSYEKAPYRAQYREDDWSFISRSMEEEGIYYWFDHEGGQTTLVFSDDSPSSDDLVGGAAIPFLHEGGMAEGEQVHDFGSCSSVATHKFTRGSFDAKRPRLKITGQAGSGLLEVYDAPGGGPPTSDGCTRFATTSLEAATATKSTVRGASNSVRIVPGRVIEIVGHPLARLSGRYFVTEVEIEAPNKAEEGVTRFRALKVEVPFRPAAVTPSAKQAGIQMGVVIGPPGDEVYPNDLGEVRVQLHWDRTGKRDAGSGTWMRPAQRGAPGSMLIPRMTWNVATFNEEGAVDAPSVLSRIHDAEHPPAYPLPENKTRVVYKTATTPGGGSFNEIYFEDKAGREEMFVNASRDMSIYVQHQHRETVGNDHTRKIGNRHEKWVDGNDSHTVLANQTTTIGGNETLEVTKDRSKAVTGSETHTVGGSRKLNVGDAYAQSNASNRTLKAPMMMDISLGNITQTAKISTTLVGGALVRLSASTIQEHCEKATLETVGGARIEISKGARGLDVMKNSLELVGGLYMVKTNGNFIDAAQKTNTWLVGGPMELKADEVIAEALEKVQIKCGDSVITVTTDEIRIEAKKIDVSGAKLDATSTSIDHN
jgi:type VI secretion system secreted protein VgrG